MDFSGKISNFAVIIKKPQDKILPELRFVLHNLLVQYVVSDDSRILSTITIKKKASPIRRSL